jgi:hypothetical protein
MFKESEDTVADFVCYCNQHNFVVFFYSPTLFLILTWGYQPERIQAGIYLLFFTLLTSLPLLVGILFVFRWSFLFGFLSFVDSCFVIYVC